MTAIQTMTIELKRIQNAQSGINKYSKEFKQLTKDAKGYHESINYMRDVIYGGKR